MIAIHRPSAAQFRAAVRKGVVGRSRGPAPPVVIDQSPGGSQIHCNFGEVALALRQPLEGGAAAQIAVPGKFLEEIEGMTQAELGEACELHRTFIGSVERGERNVAILNLRRIAKTLRVPLAELFAGDGKR